MACVELNLAAMLDKALQLLAFFILMFKPATFEQIVEVKRPPAQVIKSEAKTNLSKSNDTPNVALESMTITVDSTPDGKIASLQLDNAEPARDLQDLDAKLRRKLAVAGDAKGSGIEQVIVEIAPRLKVEEMMKILDVCRRQKLSTGQKLTKISPVLLKSAGSVVDSKGKNDPLVLNIDKEGDVVVYGVKRELEKYIALEAKASLKLAQQANPAFKAGTDLPSSVVIRADRELTFDKLHRVIEACQHQHFIKFQIRGLNNEPEKK